MRFIYAHPSDWYLTIDERRDVIEEPISDGLDLSGWDVRKALKLLSNSNPSLYEWIKSPIVYQAEPAFALLFGLLASEFYTAERSFQHYLRMAQGNYRAYLQTERVKLKKYLYVLRPLLAAQWIERGLGPVPMKFDTLVDRLVDDPNLRIHIAVLVVRKRAGEELDEGPRIPAIHAFIENEFARLEKIVPVASPVADREKLNQFFREFCFEEAA